MCASSLCSPVSSPRRAGVPRDGVRRPASDTQATAGDARGQGQPTRATGTAKNDKISVEADDFSFDATYIKTKKGTLTVALENEGNAPHTFTIDSLNIDKEIQPGKKATVEVKVPSSSAVAFYCRFHKGQGMQGAIFTKAGARPRRPPRTPAAAPTTKAPSTTGSSGYGY